LRNQQKKDRRDADEVTHVMVTECQQLLKLFGLPYITAPMEAEAQCAELVSMGLVDGIVTDDSDIFLFGGTRVYKNMFNQAKFVECYLTSDLEKEYSLDRQKLIGVAHLLGSDYTEGIPSVGPVTALEILSEFDTLEVFSEWCNNVQLAQKLSVEDSANAFRRKFRKQAQKIFLPGPFPDRRVDTAYLNPEVDSDPSSFEWGVPDLDSLRSFLMATIGWTQERTDEVLVPVIRDMNRRDTEGTQANITQFFGGGTGVGARQNTKGGDNNSAFAPRRRVEGKSRRMESALGRLHKQARKRTVGEDEDIANGGEANGLASVDNAQAEDNQVQKSDNVGATRSRKRAASKTSPASASEESDGDDDKDFQASKKPTRGGRIRANRGRGIKRPRGNSFTECLNIHVSPLTAVFRQGRGLQLHLWGCMRDNSAHRTADIVYNFNTSLWACCFDDDKDEIDCNHPRENTFQAPSPEDLESPPFSISPGNSASLSTLSNLSSLSLSSSLALSSASSSASVPTISPPAQVTAPPSSPPTTQSCAASGNCPVGLSAGAKAGIAVGAFVGLVLMLAVCIMVWRQLKRRKKHPSIQEPMEKSSPELIPIGPPQELDPHTEAQLDSRAWVEMNGADDCPGDRISEHARHALCGYTPGGGVTALAFVVTPSRCLVLAGEGPCVKVFDLRTGELLQVKWTFESQAVHGLRVNEVYQAEDGKDFVELLVWGGRKVFYGRIQDLDGDPKVTLSLNLDEDVGGWILDGQLESASKSDGDNGFPVPPCKALVVTAENVVKVLRCKPFEPSTPFTMLEHVADGPKSMLYSACFQWTEEERILVASGTVFGEILVWSFARHVLSHQTGFPATTELHYRIRGHEGSVFGVRISSKLSSSYIGKETGLLASCSDDRTIRIWDISGVYDQRPRHRVELYTGARKSIGVPSTNEDAVSSADCVAQVMGHLSRIWDVEFLISSEGISILSFGEDATTQLWKLSPMACDEEVPGQTQTRRLIHQHTFAYHSGKNIWASSVCRVQDGTHTFCTGGGDGRIALYAINSSTSVQNPFSTACTMQVAARQLGSSNATALFGKGKQAIGVQKILSEQLFDRLEGTWNIDRTINSALSTYPSGTFSGEAKFEERPSEDEAFDKEYLYSESGKFLADQGQSFTATRRYVYRLSRSKKTISAWFVKPDDHSTVDYLFHEIQPQSSIRDMQTARRDEPPIEASTYHLCSEDRYNSTYSFPFQNNTLCDWTLQHMVKGPQKQYIAIASYSRKIGGEEDVPSHSQVEDIMGASKSAEIEPKGPLFSQLEVGSFKSYTSLSSRSFLITTTCGLLLSGSIVTSARSEQQVPKDADDCLSIDWSFVGRFNVLKSSHIVERVSNSDLIILSGSNGHVFTYRYPERELQFLAPMGTKIAFLHGQRLVSSAASEAEMVIFSTSLGFPVAYSRRFSTGTADTENKSQSQSIRLVLPESFIVTSAHFLEGLNLWVLGSRIGGLAFYDLSNSQPNSEVHTCKTIRDVHDQDAITTIIPLPEKATVSQYEKQVLTTGRDGSYAVHQISESPQTNDGEALVEVTMKHRSSLTFGPNIEGAAFDHETDDLILWGFRSRHFVVWNASKDMETMTVDCGGAHRNWCYTPHNNGSDGGTFIWTKTSTCHVHSQPSASHRVLQSGGHGREIKAVGVSPMMEMMDGLRGQYIATGAEDTTIRIWSYNHLHGLKTGFRCLATLRKHITGIQQLRWSKDGKYLFSAAGREEFFAWRVQPVPILGIGVVCEAVCPPVTEDGDLRIMDFVLEEILTEDGTQARTAEQQFDLYAVYSDSSIRGRQWIDTGKEITANKMSQMYRYIPGSTPNPFHLLQSGTYNSINTLTQISLLHTSPHPFLCTASSDGHIAFWPLPQLPSAPSSSTPTSPTPKPLNNDPVLEASPLKCTNRLRIHQNFIKALCVIPLSAANTFIIITGGDDGGLGITHIQTPPATQDKRDTITPHCKKRILIPKAHAASINGLVYFGKRPQPEGKEDKEIHVIESVGGDQRVNGWDIG
ncbi:MAG: hypothetical protein Q9174_004123, partial [Haloplaca sp. 1 TL-2023]